MWSQAREIRNSGVSIVLPDHCVAKAVEIVDRTGIINEGKLILVEKNKPLIQKLGRKKLVINTC